MHTKTSFKSNTIAIATILVLFLLFTIFKPTGHATVSIDSIEWDFVENFNTLVPLNTWSVYSNPTGQIKQDERGSHLIGGEGYATLTLRNLPTDDFSLTAWEFNMKLLKANDPIALCHKCPDTNNDGKVDITDLTSVSTRNGQPGEGTIYDQDESGVINQNDITCVSNSFGKTVSSIPACQDTLSSAKMGTAVITDLNRHIVMNLYQNKVETVCGITKNTYSMDTTDDFHTYDIIIEEDPTTARLFIDQEEVLQFPTCAGTLGNVFIRSEGGAVEPGNSLLIDTFKVYYSYEDSACVPSWECDAYRECINGFQSRVCEDKVGCEADKVETQTCDENFAYGSTTTSTTIPPEAQTCESDWICDEWTECLKGIKSRDCKDNAGCFPGLTEEIQTCTETKLDCTTNWECGEWNECGTPSQTRNCVDDSSCRTPQNEQRICPEHFTLKVEIKEEIDQISKPRPEEITPEDLACNKLCVGQGFSGGICTGPADFAQLEGSLSCGINSASERYCGVEPGYIEDKTLEGVSCLENTVCNCVRLYCCDQGCNLDGECVAPETEQLTKDSFKQEVPDFGNYINADMFNEYETIDSTTCSGCLISRTCLEVGEVIYYGSDPVVCKDRRQVVYLDEELFCVDDHDCGEDSCINNVCGGLDKIEEKDLNFFAKLIEKIKGAF